MEGMLLDYLVQAVPFGKTVLMALGGLVVAGGVYVKLTPTQADDAWYAKLESMPIVGGFFKALVKFSPLSRKE